jgi:hypothetical protein
MPDLDRDKVWREFHDAVNMAPAEISEWLESDESRRVGWKGPDGKSAGESVGHASGRRIVKILEARRAELADDDWRHMRKVVGYVRRHLAQRPENQVTSRWRYSLMNWGHDPIKG